MGRFKLLLIGLVALLAVGGGVGAYLLLRVDEIPATLEVADEPEALVIQGVGNQPPLRVAELRGHTAFFVFAGIQSMRSEEGRAINRALNRWQLPDSVRGFIVFDAEGLGFFKEKAGEYVSRVAKESRFPIYGDFEGAFRAVFKVPQGHHAIIVVGPEGELLLRHSGGFETDAELESLRTLLGAQEPPPGPDVPSFEANGFNAEGCASTPCALVFLGRAVKKAELPGVDDGFEGEEEEAWAQGSKPAIRAVGSALRLKLKAPARGLIVGDTPDVEFEGWQTAADDGALRKVFGVEDGATAFLVLRDGKVAFRADGMLPFFRAGEVSDLVGVEFER